VKIFCGQWASLIRTDRFSGDADNVWKKHKPLPASRCICKRETGCDEDCQNRIMLYECDDSNCNLREGPCGNRQFADLKQRTINHKRNKHRDCYEIGIDVVKTESKGFGVRACRTFKKGQIIVEYAGEIITQEETTTRMNTKYRNNEVCYIFLFRLTN